MSRQGYSTATRREYVEANLTRYESQGYSLEDIAYDVKVAFGLSDPPHKTTIARDKTWIFEKNEEAKGPELDPDAAELLRPENFPKWRAHLFVEPATGGPYHTPPHQYALFWVIVCLAMKWDIPDWVIEYFELPEDINDLIERQYLLSLILLLAPRHGKTELVLHAILWLICYQPNIRIIYCSGILNTSQDNIDLIRMEMEENDKLIDMYGPFKDDQRRWSREFFIVAKRQIRAKAPTVLPIGRGTNPLSRDADLIIVDDPQDQDAAESEAQTSRDFRWISTQIMTRREPHTPFLGVGSHLPSPTGDLWSRIEEAQDRIGLGRHRLIMRKIKAHDKTKCREDDPEHENCILWPEVRSYGFLEAMRELLGDIMFEVCYNQEPREGNIQTFDPEIVRAPMPIVKQRDEKGLLLPPDLEMADPGILDSTRSWGEVPPPCCGTNLRQFLSLGFDPAASEQKGAAFSSLMLRTGCPRCQRRYLVDYWQKRQSPEKHVGTILYYVEKYRPGRVRIESNVYQKHLAREKDLVEAQRTYFFEIDEWNTDERKWDSSLGVPNLNHFMEAGILSVPYRFRQDREKAEPLLRTYIRWPARPNDLVIADWLAELSVGSLFEDWKAPLLTHMPGHEDLPEALKEQEVVVRFGSRHE